MEKDWKSQAEKRVISALALKEIIVQEEIKEAGLYRKVWQSFAVLPALKSVGVMGDERTYAYTVGLRIVSSEDGMTADWVKMPYEVLDKISRRIVNEVKGDSLIDVLKNSHITALSQIIHVEMIQIFHVVSEGFLDAKILGDHNPHVKILLIKTFRQGAHYVRQTARLNKRNRF